MESNDIMRRAMAAYFRNGGTAQPASSSAAEEVDGLTYAVLRNINGVLAVYRLRPNGVLKGLKRWPKALE